MSLLKGIFPTGLFLKTGNEERIIVENSAISLIDSENELMKLINEYKIDINYDIPKKTIISITERN